MAQALSGYIRNHDPHRPLCPARGNEYGRKPDALSWTISPEGLEDWLHSWPRFVGGSDPVRSEEAKLGQPNQRRSSLRAGLARAQGLIRSPLTMGGPS